MLLLIGSSLQETSDEERSRGSIALILYIYEYFLSMLI